MKTTPSTWIAAVTGLLASMTPALAFADGFDEITEWWTPDGIHHYSITRPDPTVPTREYPTVVLPRGAQVQVSAMGCVQTGGHGLTWKRYVDPQGDNSDELYHGLIRIPGAIDSLTRFEDILDNSASSTWYTIEFDTYVTLGYEDDHYEDNGYWGWDKGTQDQCVGLYQAEVDIAILSNQ